VIKDGWLRIVPCLGLDVHGQIRSFQNALEANIVIALERSGFAFATSLGLVAIVLECGVLVSPNATVMARAGTASAFALPPSPDQIVR